MSALADSDIPPTDIPTGGLGRKVLREQIRELLTARIFSGHYQPGERLVETRIATEVGTSQAPVREALRELENLGLVDHEPFKGTRVRDPRPEELLAVFPVREALETLAIKLATGRLAKDPSALRERLAGMRAAAKAGDAHGFIANDAGFHAAIVHAADNRPLLDAWNAIGVDRHAYVTITRLELELPEVAESHVPIMEALERGKAGEAAKEMRAHLAGFARQARADNDARGDG